MDLENQVLKRSKEISTDAYSMSVGEIISLYKEKELDIHPEFQRFFRWTSRQKSNFIESLLLGIPIPSIFVSQKQEGAWDVVDGLQRLSTILQLTGDLRDENDNPVEPLVLEKTRYLSELEGKEWKSDDPENQLPQSSKLKIKRARLDLKIVMNTSDKTAKYELFQRLNTGGSLATAQEVRNCLLIMLNRDFYNWFSNITEDEDFQKCLPLSRRLLDERYDMELVIRFLVFRTIPGEQLNRKTIGDLGTFLTEKVVEFAQSQKLDLKAERRAFRRTFKALADALGEDIFKKFDPDKDRALGSFLISVYEAIAIGMGHYSHNEEYEITKDRIHDIHRKLWSDQRFIKSTGSGIRAADRIPVTVALGRKYFET